eukprot:g15694.t1
MPWFQEPHLIFSRLLGLSTTLWLCCKVGHWAQNLSRFGSLLLRILRPPRLWRYPDYGHLLMVPLYPGNPPSPEAKAQAARLMIEAQGEEAQPATALNPPNAEAYLVRARNFNSRGLEIAALDDAEMCISIDAKCAEGWLEKGKAELALGRLIDAAQSFHQGLQLAPDHQELELGARREEWDLVFAARLGLEHLFRTLEDPQKTTDAFVESNAAVLDQQLGLLAQTLHVNTSVLFESPRLCDAYEQILGSDRPSLLTAGHWRAFGLFEAFGACRADRSRAVPGRADWMARASRHCEACRGWAHHAGLVPHRPRALAPYRCEAAFGRLAAMAPGAHNGQRWLKSTAWDARPEPESHGEEICGCNCLVPWKAAACFLEKLLEPQNSLVQQECEAWPDSVQLCQWLTLSVRDYHATPLGLVALLQMPGVAQKAMKSQAKVDFFIAPHFFGDDFSLDEQFRFVAAAAAAAAQPPGMMDSRASGTAPQVSAAALASVQADLDALRWLPDPPPPPAQRLGEWLMNSLGYLFLFIEGDALFTVYACQALQMLAKSDPDGDGRWDHPKRRKRRKAEVSPGQRRI